MGTHCISFVSTPASNDVNGVTYSSSVIRSCNNRLIEATVVSEGDDSKVIWYRRERSKRDTDVSPHAAQIDVALDENAEVNVMRGPNSIMMVVVLLPPLLSEEVETKDDFSNCNPPLSNVSASNHSKRDVSTSLSGVSSCTLKHDSVSTRRMDAAASSDESCSLMDGRRECGVGVLR